MITKDAAVERAVAFAREHNNILLEWATGVGKSKAAIDIIRDYHSQTGIIPSILLMVAENAHKLNWQNEFSKWEADEYWPHITIECYASLKNYRGSVYDILILDESHHIGTDIRKDVLSTITVKKVIALSATVKDIILEYLEELFGEFHVFNISLTDAIENNILPVPKIYLIPLQLDNTVNKETIVVTRGRSDKRVLIKCHYSLRWYYLRDKNRYPNLTLEMECTEFEKYLHLTEQFEYYKKQFFITRQEHLKNKWLRIGSERKRFMGDIKSNFVVSLLSQIWNRRFICFCSSIEQAEYLGGDCAIHSEKRDSQTIIQKFNNKEINHLFAVNMLQEGQNLVDIEAGIIVQLDGQERAFVQKFGRTLRADSPEQYIFYYQDTRDQEYLEKALEGINQDYVKTINNVEEHFTKDQVLSTTA